VVRHPRGWRSVGSRRLALQLSAQKTRQVGSGFQTLASCSRRAPVNETSWKNLFSFYSLVRYVWSLSAIVTASKKIASRASGAGQAELPIQPSDIPINYILVVTKIALTGDRADDRGFAGPVINQRESEAQKKRKREEQQT